MPITQGDLSFRRALVNDDTTSNGGRITLADVGTNLFPDVTGQQRQDGAVQYRKAFLKNSDADGNGYPALTLYDGKVFIQQISPAGDSIGVKAGTELDTYGSYAANETWKTLGWHGVGYFYPNPTGAGTPVDYAPVGATMVRVVCDQNWVSNNLFFPGTVLFDNGSGTSQFVTVSSVSLLGGTQNVVELTFATTPLSYQFDCYAYSYTADAGGPGNKTDETHIGNATCNFGVDNNPALLNKLVLIKSGTGAGQIRRITGNTATQLTVEYSWTTIPVSSTFVVLKTTISMCCPVGNVAASKYDFTVPNGKTFYDANVKIFAVGAIDETWTIRCVDAGPTYVWVEGATIGQVVGPEQNGSFPIAAGVKPANAFGQSFYFEIPFAAWGGGFDQNSVVTFKTKAAAKGIWVKRTVPVGCSAHLSNSWELSAAGDTV